MTSFSRPSGALGALPFPVVRIVLALLVLPFIAAGCASRCSRRAAT